jgi:DNA replication and repair protein RecF
MHVAHLALTDFRNYRSADVALAPGVTVLIGPNGQGKTNLVEAIGYLASGGSHRVSTDQALVRNGADRAFVRARLQHGTRIVTIEVELNRSSANRLLVNGSPVKSREARRYLDSVLFAPEDLALVRGDPGGRRRFLDQLLVARHPRMAGVIADYDRVLRQRTTLLKSARATRGAVDLTTLEIWDDRLAALGSEIIDARAALITELGPHAAEAYRAIAGADHALELRMRSTVAGIDPEEDDEDGPAAPVDDTLAAFRDRVAAVRMRELERGLTLVGPHRDDLEIDLNGMPARTTASHGESWSAALSLKLAGAQLLRETGPAGDPVIILDDVFAELDAGRRSRLIAAVTITCS